MIKMDTKRIEKKKKKKKKKRICTAHKNKSCLSLFPWIKKATLFEQTSHAHAHEHICTHIPIPSKPENSICPRKFFFIFLTDGGFCFVLAPQLVTFPDLSFPGAGLPIGGISLVPACLLIWRTLQKGRHGNACYL